MDRVLFCFLWVTPSSCLTVRVILMRKRVEKDEKIHSESLATSSLYAKKI